MSLIYLASPYSHEKLSIRENRYETNIRVAATMIKAGFHIFSPVVHSHPLTEFCRTQLSETRFKDYYLFKHHERLCTNMVRKCDAFWILTIDGWKISEGVRKEFDLAKKLYLDISLIDEDCNIKPFFESDYRS